MFKQSSYHLYLQHIWVPQSQHTLWPKHVIGQSLLDLHEISPLGVMGPLGVQQQSPLQHAMIFPGIGVQSAAVTHVSVLTPPKKYVAGNQSTYISARVVRQGWYSYLKEIENLNYKIHICQIEKLVFRNKKCRTFCRRGNRNALSCF